MSHHDVAFDRQALAILPLPAPLTSFIGREREMREVKHLLASSRLVTMTGSGGCGKTRLALRVVTDLANQYADGVCWVDLAPLADANLLLRAVAKALNIAEQTGRALLDVIIDLLRVKCLLLVLDNCEHLASACAEFAHDALCDASQVSILATSREPLSVMGELLYPVAPLAFPPKSQKTDLAQFDSIRLFVERARGVLPNFTLTSANAQFVADICRRLDGIPLAIELASARVNALSVEQIAARLDDRFSLLTSARRGVPSHHRTLRAALDWSYDSLSAEERILLQRLSVFAGGCTLQAVEQVCEGDGTESEQIVCRLASLVNRSLVIAETLAPGEARYWMLETIRQYAGDKLRESGEGDTIRNRHLDYFLKFALEAESRLHGPEQNEWLDRLDSDHDNLRAALDWSCGEGRVERGLRLAAALLWFWEMRTYWTEGRERAKALLIQPEAAPRTLARANALLVVASMGGWGGVNKPERPSAEELITIAREQGAAGKRTLALGLAQLSHTMFYDDGPGAIALVDEGLDVASALHDEWLVAYLFMLKGFYFLHGDCGPAARTLEDSLRRFTALGDKFWANTFPALIGFVYYQQGDLARARQGFERYLTLAGELKDRGRLVVVLGWLGDTERASGKYDLAKRYFAEFLKIARQIGDKGKILDATYGLGFVSLYENDLNYARLLFAETLALRRELKLSTSLVVNGLFAFACLAAAEKQAPRAARLFAVSECLYRDEHALPADVAEYKRYLALARTQLDEATFNATWEEGKQMTVEQAIEFTLKDEPETMSAPAPDLPRDPDALTPRETEVLRLVAAGLSDAQVAAKLVISRRTVSTHLTAICGKLGVNSRSAAIRSALDRKLI